MAYVDPGIVNVMVKREMSIKAASPKLRILEVLSGFVAQVDDRVDGVIDEGVSVSREFDSILVSVGPSETGCTHKSRLTRI
jgi:hypothetical protein